MHRRDALKVGAALGGVAVAGCLDVFETESVWRNAPLVEDRPDAVYVPAGREQMGTYGTARAGRYAVALQYTFPHRFWTVSGTSTNRVEVGEEDSLHLMVTVWDAETGVVLPAEPRLELHHDGSIAASRTLWTMLSQRMGFHYGDNLELDEEGQYVATIRLPPVDADAAGDLTGQFQSAETAEIEFEYDTGDVYDLEYDQIGETRRGARDAVPLMRHGSNGSDGSDGGVADPIPTVPAPEELPGQSLGTATSGDAVFAAALVSGSRVSEDRQYLLVSPRTPYNSIPIPQIGVTATVSRGRNGEAVYDGQLHAAVDGRVGIHYGAAVEGIQRGDAVTVTIDTSPQVARHDGYETAFFEMSPVEFTVG